jgi:hypothetical protein
MEQIMVTAQATCLRSAMPSFGASCLGVERQLWLDHACPERAMT